MMQPIHRANEPKSRSKKVIHFIPQWAKHKGFRQVDLVNETGIDKGVVSKWYSGNLPLEDNLVAVASFLGVTKADLFRHPDSAPLLTFSEDDLIPIRGTVAASLSGNSSFELSGETVDFVPRTPTLANALNVYALRVMGDSMIPRYYPGELIFVNPDKPVTPGDFVVIREPTSNNGQPMNFIKQFKSRTDDTIVAMQFNPYSEFTFTKKSRAEMHRVLSTNEVFGV